jgi:hypothetical protein
MLSNGSSAKLPSTETNLHDSAAFASGSASTVARHVASTGSLGPRA